ncbi:MAG: hypothetical protein J5I98_02395 [Phaeodactylibacter sp.]|nr:hypothetical protein [Phaeodactylibacter sp.]
MKPTHKCTTSPVHTVSGKPIAVKYKIKKAGSPRETGLFIVSIAAKFQKKLPTDKKCSRTVGRELVEFPGLFFDGAGVSVLRHFGVAARAFAGRSATAGCRCRFSCTVHRG